MTFSLRVSKSRTTNSQPPFPWSPNFPYYKIHPPNETFIYDFRLPFPIFIHPSKHTTSRKTSNLWVSVPNFLPFFAPDERSAKCVGEPYCYSCKSRTADVSFSASSSTIVKKCQKMSEIAFLFWWKSAVAEIWVREDNTKVFALKDYI